jgi:hypothetical protein
MEQINLIQAKGGQGTSVTACGIAVQAARDGWHVRLEGHDRDALAAILGTGGDGPVTSGMTLGAGAAGETYDLIVHDGPADHGTALLVTRPCYLALRRAVNQKQCADVAGVVLVSEPGRSLLAEDITAVTGLPIIATIPVRADIARAVDAGVLADRLPEQLTTAARRILQFAICDNTKKVA